MTEPLDVLALAAHPDDAEIGCGGTLILAVEAGLRVGIAELTAGERATRGTPEIRAAERDRASEVMGVTVRVSLGLPDGALGVEPAQRDAVIRLLRELRPDIVLAPYTEDRHPDHAAAGMLARDASYLAGVAKLSEGEAHRPAALYHYMVHQPFRPSFVVDVSRVWDRKMRAVRAYVSQVGAGSTDVPTELSHGALTRMAAVNAAFYGAMVGAERGEPFHSRGPVGLPFLPGFDDVGPGRPRGYRSFL